jgi:Tfp pilus assembly protein PilN
MLRKFCFGFFFLALVLPGATLAGGYTAPTTEDLLQRIDQLTQELQKVKQQLQEVQANQREQGQDLYNVKAKQQEQTETVAEVGKGLDDLLVDGIGRFELWGDYRFRADSTYLHQPTYWDASTMLVTGMPTLRSDHDPDNDSIYTNRFRLNLQAKASDNLTFKARLAMYKLWGMDSDYAASGEGIFPLNLMTNNMTYGIRPSDARIYVDRAYVNWTNIGGLPVWFSVGRRPTTHTIPTQFREGLEGRDATPFGANMDIPFDGLTLGYQYHEPLPVSRKSERTRSWMTRTSTALYGMWSTILTRIYSS